MKPSVTGHHHCGQYTVLQNKDMQAEDAYIRHTIMRILSTWHNWIHRLPGIGDPPAKLAANCSAHVVHGERLQLRHRRCWLGACEGCLMMGHTTGSPKSQMGPS